MAEELVRITRAREEFLIETEGDTDDYSLRRKVFRVFEDAAETKRLSTGATTPITTAGGDGLLGPAATTNGSNGGSVITDRGERSSFDLEAFLRLSRRFFWRLRAMDYCEHVPRNLIWCGFLRIQWYRGRRSDEDPPPIRVGLVVHPRGWTLQDIRLFRNATRGSFPRGGARTERAAETQSERQTQTQTQRPTIDALVVPHRFLPVGRRGRLVGITQSDRELLRQVSERLERSLLVARFSCTITSSGREYSTTTAPTSSGDTTTSTAGGESVTAKIANRQGQFTVKAMSFAQAQQRLDAAFRGRLEPGGLLSEVKDEMVLNDSSVLSVNNDNNSGEIDNITNDRNSLLCSWSHEFLWEDSENFVAETSSALQDTMNEYDKIVREARQSV